MPYPFTLPTTSAFSFSSSVRCGSHPSLPLQASTHRGVVRDALKKHKRLPPASQASNLASVAAALTSYLPYLFAVDAGLSHRAAAHGEDISVLLLTTPVIEWRPTLSAVLVPGLVKQDSIPRVKLRSLECEVAFALATLANTHTLQARAALHPLHVTSSAPVGTQQRQAAIASATRLLLDAAGLYDYLGARAAPAAAEPPPCVDIAPATVRAQAALARAEATLLAVLKDDPYPAVVAQDRNANDNEWMYKAPDIPKVRAHLFARLCLAAAEHAAQAHSLCAAVKGGGDGGGGGGGGGAKLNDRFVRYLEDMRKTCRAKACRFFGIDAELGGQTGTAIAWLNAGLQELGIEPRDPAKRSMGLGRLKKEWTEKREDRKVEKGADWGADAGKLEEVRVIEVLETKWTKQNDTVRLPTACEPTSREALHGRIGN